MEPSKGLEASADQSGELSIENSSTDAKEKAPPLLVDEDLFAIPKELQPTYRPLDWFSSTLLIGVMGNIALIWDGTLKSQKIRNFFQLMFNKGPAFSFTQLVLEFQRASWSTWWQWIRWLIGFLARCAFLTTVSTMLLQDIFLRPSRLSARILKEQFTLPSTLSRFEQLEAQGQNVTANIGLHWLEYNNYDNARESKRVVYFNHGFGASSLSWLPCLKRLTKKLGCQIGLAHDALGFGFSEISSKNSDGDPLYWYSTAGSADLAKSLLHQKYPLSQNDTIVLVGHSLGALTTLKMSLNLPKEAEKRIILVAPALGIRQPPSGKSTEPTRKSSGLLRIARTWLLERPSEYVLRRAVGRPGFWRSGLKVAWGDAKRLKDNDVLRFQWPSIHRGWETGLVRFTRAQSKLFQHDRLGPMPDEELLIRVLAMPNTRVEVILGENDRIVPTDRVRKFLKPFPNISVTELAGLGHDPFEEDVEAFLQAIV